MSLKKFWSIVGSAESDSEHPLGRALLEHAKTVSDVDIVAPKNFKAKTGIAVSVKL